MFYKSPRETSDRRGEPVRRKAASAFGGSGCVNCCGAPVISIIIAGALALAAGIAIMFGGAEHVVRDLQEIG
jgi:hypothetical protein